MFILITSYLFEDAYVKAFSHFKEGEKSEESPQLRVIFIY